MLNKIDHTKLIPFTLLLLIFITTTGCGKKEVTLENVIHSDVFYEGEMIDSTKDQDILEDYLFYLVNGTPFDEEILDSADEKKVNKSISKDIYYNQDNISRIKDLRKKLENYAPDMTYDLEIRTTKELLKYTVGFDMTHGFAIATDELHRYIVPYEWLTMYLNYYLPKEQFAYMNSPIPAFYMDDYKITTSINTDWTVQLTNEVSYNIPAEQINYETLQPTKSYSLRGEFGHNRPDRIEVQVITPDGVSPLTEENPRDDGNDDPKDPLTIDLPVPEGHGAFLYTVTCVWEQADHGASAFGTSTYTFGIEYRKPVSYKLNGDSFEPGDCIGVLLENAIGLDYRVETPTYSRTIGLFYREADAAASNAAKGTVAIDAFANYIPQRDLVGLIPLDSKTEPGDYTIKIYQNSTNKLLHTFDYTVAYKEFDKQYLRVTESTASLKNDENRRKDNEKFGDAKSYSVGNKLWEGSFLQPVEGRISTEYSAIRFVNDNKVESYRHNAIDIAAPQGTPIKATNNGIVTFASDLIISGNVICLDHGYGVFSSYVHLYKIYVEEGQEVKKGEVIGEVGTTGYSTGPHLHWSIWKNGVFLNPWKFIDEDPLATFY